MRAEHWVGDIVNLIDKPQQWICGVTGHEDLMVREDNRVYVECQKCGRKSRGINVREPNHDGEVRHAV